MVQGQHLKSEECHFVVSLRSLLPCLATYLVATSGSSDTLRAVAADSSGKRENMGKLIL